LRLRRGQSGRARSGMLQRDHMHYEELKSILTKLRPVIGEMADAFWLSAILEPERIKDVLAVSQAMAAELLEESYTGKHILLEPPPSKKVRGEYPLGMVIYADKPMGVFGLRESDMPQHLLILGRSGAGKSNVGYLLVYNLLRAGKPFIILDWRGNYRHFLNRPEGKSIYLFSLVEEESLSFNPLEAPPNLTENQREAYLRDVISVICTTYLPGHHLLSTHGVEYFFMKAVELLYADGGKPLNFNDIKHYVEGYKAYSREKDWKVSAVNVLFKLTSGPIGRVMNDSCATNLASVLNKPVILDLKSLGSQTDRSMFTQTFLLWLYYYRLAEGKSSFKHSIIVEEAHNLFLRNSSSGQSVHDLMLRQMRELGESIILLDQNPSLLSTPAMGNTGITIALNLKHMNDVMSAGKALTLPQKEWDYIGRLHVGYGIVKMQDRWVKPFLVRFPLFPVNSDIKASLNKGDHLRSSSLKRSVEELQSALNGAIRVLREEDGKKEKRRGISEQERSLLFDIAKYPFSVVTERYQRLGWSAHTGTKIKGKLLEMNIIKQERIGIPEGSVTLLEPTEKGRELLSSWGIKVSALPKNASLEHEYWKWKVAENYRNKGYEVIEEKPVGEGRSVDLVARKNEKEIAIEIETGKSDILGNINKCLKAGFDSVVCIATSSILKNWIVTALKRDSLYSNLRLDVICIGDMHSNEGNQNHQGHAK